MPAICVDCKKDTAPKKGNGEWYMVHDEVWASAGPMERDPRSVCIGLPGYLCIGCLERRLDRHLVPEDFTSAPINEIDRGHKTMRLLDRLGFQHG